MDLHLTDAKASAEEKTAIDAVLGKAEANRDGGERDVASEVRATFNGQPTHSKRHLLLPVLHVIQERIGWISPGALNYASLS